MDLTASDHIVIAAPAEGGDSLLSPEEAAILGWVFTDGTIRHSTVTQEGHTYGPYPRLTISQSKPQYVEEIRSLVADVASEAVTPARVQALPGSRQSSCLPAYRWSLRTPFVRELLTKTGITTSIDLPALVLRLSQPARAAMLDAMLKGDGTRHRGRNTWTFGKKRKPGVMEAFELLATLEGYALGTPRMSSVGEVPVRTVRVNRLVATPYLKTRQGGAQPVWCPTTPLGTWVMRLDGSITITGNTRAKARALRDAVNVGVVVLEELDDSGEGEVAARPKPQAQQQAAKSEPAPEQRQQAPSANGAAQPTGNGCSEKQQKMIFALAKEKGIPSNDVNGIALLYWRHKVPELTKAEASEFIDKLQKGEIKVSDPELFHYAGKEYPIPLALSKLDDRDLTMYFERLVRIHGCESTSALSTVWKEIVAQRPLLDDRVYRCLEDEAAIKTKALRALRKAS